jgi:exodeoxyribonuclease VII small subunit
MSSKQESQVKPREIVFEAGYERMKEIGSRLDSGEVTVAEMCDLYAEGKGLGRALMEYLDEREGELQEIDEGRNLPRFKVVATAGEVQAEGSREPAAPAAQDEIPF